MSQTSDDKPRVADYKSTQSHRPYGRWIIVASTVLAIIALLLISISYLTHDYIKPAPSSTAGQPIIKNLTIEPIDTLTEDELADEQESKALASDNTNLNTDKTAEDTITTPRIKNRSPEAVPTGNQKTNNVRASNVNVSITDSPSDSTLEMANKLHLPSQKNNQNNQDIDHYFTTNDEAAAAADAIDEQLSIAIDQVRQINEKKLANVLTHQRNENTTVDNLNNTPSE